MPEEIILLEEQKALTLKLFGENPKIPLAVLTQRVFQDPFAKSTDPKAKAVRAFLVTQKLDLTPVTPKTSFELSEEQREFIRNNKDNFKTIPEMISVMFPEVKNGSVLSTQGRAVMAYFKEMNPLKYAREDEPVDNDYYEPPKSLKKLVSIVNTFLTDGKPYKWDNEKDSLNSADDKRMRTLWGYVKTDYYIVRASFFKRKQERTLFEANFIRFAHDKTDLLSTEVNQAIDWSAEVINGLRIERQVADLESQIDEIRNDPDNKGRLNQGLVDHLNSTREKWDKSKERQKKLLEKLEEDRAERINRTKNQSDSVWKLVELWKQAESRNKLIAIAEKFVEEDEKEFDNLKNMDDVKVLIAGLTKEEAIRGL